MASLEAVLEQLVTLAKPALQAVVPGVIVGSEWPGVEVRKKAAENGPPVVAIFHKFTNFQNKDFPFEMSETVGILSLEGVLSETVFSPGTVVTLELQFANSASVVSAGDLISCVFAVDNQFQAATYKAETDSSLTAMAVGLAQQITLEIPGVSAIATGQAITLTNNSSTGYLLWSHSGQTFLSQDAVKWAVRALQMNVWSGNLTNKYKLQLACEDFLSDLDDVNGFTLPSGEFIQVEFSSNKAEYNDTDKNLFTDMFLFNASHWVDLQREKWAVVAPLPSLQDGA